MSRVIVVMIMLITSMTGNPELMCGVADGQHISVSTVNMVEKKECPAGKLMDDGVKLRERKCIARHSEGRWSTTAICGTSDH